MLARFIIGAIALGLAAPASAQPASAQWRATLVARSGDGAYSDHAVQARVGETVDVRVALRSPDGRVLADVRVGSRRPDGPLPAVRVEWLRVVPRYEAYSNVVQWGALEGEWRGIEPVLYLNQPLAGNGASLTLSRRELGDGAGTMWLAAIVTLPDGTRVHTPDASSTDDQGLERSVLRVSFRAGDDFLGWLSTYFGVPSIFGSVGRQVDRYVGADCADVLVGALRAMGRGMRYVSVAGISRYARPLGDVITIASGRPNVVLRWGHDVAPGDLVAIDFDTGVSVHRRWDHIGALVSDDGDGVLDAGDIVRHMTPYGLADRPLREQGTARVRFWRWRFARDAGIAR